MLHEKCPAAREALWRSSSLTARSSWELPNLNQRPIQLRLHLELMAETDYVNYAQTSRPSQRPRASPTTQWTSSSNSSDLLKISNKKVPLHSV